MAPTMKCKSLTHCDTCDNGALIRKYIKRVGDCCNRDLCLCDDARKMPPSLMLRRYEEKFPDKKDRVGRTMFMYLVKRLTCHGSKAKTAVDYCTLQLVTDPFNMMRRMIRKLVPVVQQPTFMQRCDEIEIFLKVNPYNNSTSH